MNEPEDEFEKVLWEYLKNVVHCLNLESVDIYMLIERKYPLSAEVCKAMLDKKLQGGKPDEDCYKLLKMMEKQVGIRNSRRTINVEKTSSKAMVAIDRAGFDWSCMADEEVPTSMALIAFSDSEVPTKPSLKVDKFREERIVFAPAVTSWNVSKAVNTARPNSVVVNVVKASACYMTGNMSYLLDFKEFDGGYVTFGGGAKGGKITGKGTLKTGKLNFEDVYFVKELQFNLFSVLQMCYKKNNVLFIDTGCFVLSRDFKLADESPRKNNMYSVDMKNIVLKECLTCLVAKATLDESML
ncbi:hypothetical protein Tco_0864497 [Tanacetum coccineum]